VGNKIRQYRISKGLTQRALAEAAGTSQQQVQRIEAGVQAVRIETAMRICAAVDQTLDKVFPSTRAPLRKIRAKTTSSEYVHGEEFLSEMGKAGIDLDPAQWTLKVWLRDHNPRDFPISRAEKDRLWNSLQTCDPSQQFVVFDSGAQRVAIRLNHLLAWQFLFDEGISTAAEYDEPVGLCIWFSGRPQAVEFKIGCDSADLDEYENEDELPVQLQHLFFEADSFEPDMDAATGFMDVDGEDVFFRLRDVTMMTVPLWAVEPELGQMPPEAGEALPGDAETPRTKGKRAASGGRPDVKN